MPVLLSVTRPGIRFLWLLWRDTHSSSCLWESRHSSKTCSNREAAEPAPGHPAGVWRGQDTHGFTPPVGGNAGQALV